MNFSWYLGTQFVSVVARSEKKCVIDPSEARSRFMYINLTNSKYDQCPCVLLTPCQNGGYEGNVENNSNNIEKE